MKCFSFSPILRCFAFILMLLPVMVFAGRMELPLEDYNPTFKQPYKFVPLSSGKVVSQVQLGDFEMKVLDLQEIATGIKGRTINPALYHESMGVLEDVKEWAGLVNKYGRHIGYEPARAAWYAEETAEELNIALKGVMTKELVYANYYNGKLEAAALVMERSNGSFEIDRLFANPDGLIPETTDSIKGAGTNLLQRIALDAKGRGYSSVKLSSASSKVSYYTKQGFHLADTESGAPRPSVSHPSTSGACN